MKFIFGVIIFFSSVITLNSQPLRINQDNNIIIDTDCGIDDYRAIAILLSQPAIHIKGFITTEGNTLPEIGLEKLTGFLRETGQDSIPVVPGKGIKGKSPSWRDVNHSMKWSTTPGFVATDRSPSDLLSEYHQEKITFLCLGPLTNISEIIMVNPGLLKKVDRIIWYNDGVMPLRGFNYEYDNIAARKVIDSGIRIDMISNLNKQEAVFNTSLIPGSDSLTTFLSRALFQFNKQNILSEECCNGQHFLRDDLTALYLCNPMLFEIKPMTGKSRIRYNTGYDLISLKEVLIDMCTGKYFPDENIVFTKFPDRREFFSYDVRQIMDEVIQRYGKEEWKACVMTDEFHGHLGIYSIVGAKMGIKVREIFGVGPDLIRVKSYAGSKPPYSCLNDGIQVSTGATLGLGLIELAPSAETKAMADFSYKDRTIRISLKDKYLREVEDDIKESIVRFGLLDDGYWKMVRQSALRCWLEWDKNEIFLIEEMKPGAERR